MIIKVSDSIISPLGVGSEENFIRVSKGESMLRRHEDAEGLLQPYYASLFTERRVFSELCIEAAEEALQGSGVDASSDKVLFVRHWLRHAVKRLRGRARSASLQALTTERARDTVASFRPG